MAVELTIANILPGVDRTSTLGPSRGKAENSLAASPVGAEE